MPVSASARSRFSLRQDLRRLILALADEPGDEIRQRLRDEALALLPDRPQDREPGDEDRSNH